MTRIKMCGLRCIDDIQTANELSIDYIGFIFAPKSRRYVTEETAVSLKAALDPKIKAVGVFVDDDMEHIAYLLENGIIDIAQLHGHEDVSYVKALREKTAKPIWQAFSIKNEDDAKRAMKSEADMILLDSPGGGSGQTFDWQKLENISRPYMLAGGLTVQNASEAISQCHPYGLDVSSGIETDGIKDKEKMTAFAKAVREEDNR